MVERSKDWLQQAKSDLRAADYNMKGGFNEWACFLAQQAGEKALKAVFQKLGGEAHGHSVATMIAKLPRSLRPSPKLLEMGKELDKAYIPTRYPNAHPAGSPSTAYTEAEARRLIDHAKTIVEYCEDMLSKI